MDIDMDGMVLRLRRQLQRRAAVRLRRQLQRREARVRLQLHRRPTSLRRQLQEAKRLGGRVFAGTKISVGTRILLPASGIADQKEQAIQLEATTPRKDPWRM